MLWNRKSSTTGSEKGKEASGKSFLASLFGGGAGKPSVCRKRVIKGGLRGQSSHVNDYGLWDYRFIPWWNFATHPFLEPTLQAKISIGTLYIKVVEARNLMSADISGKSDPYIKLCLTGRYLSHGQEWSKHLRLHDRTVVVKNTLNPSWEEEFIMPVRRAGAVLKVEVWDRDRSSADDPLGHFEVKIGEELLSQEWMDMWYVLEPPPGMSVSPVMAAPGSQGEKHGTIDKEEGGDEGDGSSLQGHDDTGDLEDTLDTEFQDEPNNSPVGSPGTDTSAHGRKIMQASSKPFFKSTSKFFRSKPTTSTSPGHSHTSGKEASKCEICIELRRKRFGEVRLKLWFQFDEFGETCSHLWPEELKSPTRSRFSPNQLYRKGMILWAMSQPYVNFMQDADQILCWVHFWRSMRWMLTILVILSSPYLFFVVINGAVMRIAVSAYLKHRFSDNTNKKEPAVPQVPQAAEVAPVAAEVTPVAAVAAAANQTQTLEALNSFSLPSGNEIFNSSVRPTSSGGARAGYSAVLISPPESPGSSVGGPSFSDMGIGDYAGRSPSEDGSVRSLKKKIHLTTFSRITMALRSRSSSGHEADARDSGEHSAQYSSVEGKGEVGQSFSLPSSRRSSVGQGSASRPATPTMMPSITLDGGPGVASFRPIQRSSSPSHSAAPKSPSFSITAFNEPNDTLALADTGDTAALGAAVSGGKRINKVLPSLVTRDPELEELDRRLSKTKMLPLVFNEVGKRVIGKNGPLFQRQVEKMGMQLIKMRGRLHPLHAKHLVLVIVAITTHTLLQLWLYHTGRFNFYFVLVSVGVFSDKLYTRRGKSFVLAVKEAARTRRTRLSLRNNFPVSPSAAEEDSSDVRSSRLVATLLAKIGKENHLAFTPPGTRIAAEQEGGVPTADASRGSATSTPTRSRRSINPAFYSSTKDGGSCKSSPARSPSHDGRGATPLSSTVMAVSLAEGLKTSFGSEEGKEGGSPSSSRVSDGSSSWQKYRGLGQLLYKRRLKNKMAACSPAAGFPSIDGDEAGGLGIIHGSVSLGREPSTVFEDQEGENREKNEEVASSIRQGERDKDRSSPVSPLSPRDRPGRNSQKTSQRVRWGRVFGAFLVLVCGIAVGVAALVRAPSSNHPPPVESTVGAAAASSR